MQYFINRFIFVLILSPIFTGSCSRGQEVSIPERGVRPEPVSESLIQLSEEWIKDKTAESFPKDIEVYQRTKSYNNKSLKAVCVVFNPASTVIEFKPVLVDRNKKLADIYSEESGIKYAAINAGFFGTNVSYSLILDNEVIRATNIISLKRLFNEVSTTYYPTRGAFGINSSGRPDISWIYHTGGSYDIIYSYPFPAANALNSFPKPQPSASSPQGGKIWDMTKAVGGSPILLKDGNLRLTDAEELISVDNVSSRARSAIGYTERGNVVLLAVEGNNNSGGVGLSLKELALLMKEMGCIAALNLDGGGSTSMIINGAGTVKPSDVGVERPVMSAIIIKRR